MPPLSLWGDRLSLLCFTNSPGSLTFREKKWIIPGDKHKHNPITGWKSDRTYDSFFFSDEWLLWWFLSDVCCQVLQKALAWLRSFESNLITRNSGDVFVGLIFTAASDLWQFTVSATWKNTHEKDLETETHFVMRVVGVDVTRHHDYMT